MAPRFVRPTRCNDAVRLCIRQGRRFFALDSFTGRQSDIRELRVRADAGFGYHPVLEILEARPTQYTVVARLTPAFQRLLPGLGYEPVNQ
jgi:hypothetical protein